MQPKLLRPTKEGPAWLTGLSLSKEEERTEWAVGSPTRTVRHEGGAGPYTKCSTKHTRTKDALERLRPLRMRGWEEMISKFVQISKFRETHETEGIVSCLLWGYLVEATVSIS